VDAVYSKNITVDGCMCVYTVLRIYVYLCVYGLCIVATRIRVHRGKLRIVGTADPISTVHVQLVQQVEMIFICGVAKGDVGNPSTPHYKTKVAGSSPANSLPCEL
jgi:hypothetical protein